MNILLNQENDRLRNVLLYSLLDDGMRERIGLKGVSQFFHAGQGWYFWLLQREGVYEIEFLDRKEKQSCISIEFVLKYYPHPDEAVFADYSFIEQVMRLQYPFEQNCPTPKCREQLGARSFYVGKLILHWYEEAVLLSLSAQNRWKEYLQEELRIKNNEGVFQEVAKAGEKDRDVPGWSISFDLYSCLMKAFCFIYRSTPQMIGLGCSPGKIEYVGATERVRKEAGGDVLAISLTAAIPFQGELSASEEMLEAVRLFSGRGGIIYQEGKKNLLHLYPQLFVKDWWLMAESGRKMIGEDLRV